MNAHEIADYIRENYPEWKPDKESTRAVNLALNYKNNKLQLKIKKNNNEITVKFIGLKANDYRTLDYHKARIQWIEKIEELFT